MELLPFTLPTSSDKLRTWDLYAPIVKTDTGYRIYITDEIEGPDTYAEAYNILRTAQKHETIEFIINTPGGVIDSALMLVDGIKLSKAKTQATLSGTVASAGTLISLACDKLEISDSTIFMIHNYSAGSHGKGHELKARQEFIDRHLRLVFTQTYSSILSDEEIEDVIEGKDIWLSGDEVRQRLKGAN